jgi:hypothetical protein
MREVQVHLYLIVPTQLILTVPLFGPLGIEDLIDVGVDGGVWAERGCGGDCSKDGLCVAVGTSPVNGAAGASGDGDDQATSAAAMVYTSWRNISGGWHRKTTEDSDVLIAGSVAEGNAGLESL